VRLSAWTNSLVGPRQATATAAVPDARRTDMPATQKAAVQDDSVVMVASASHVFPTAIPVEAAARGGQDCDGYFCGTGI
jgi:hypothetical protein